MNLLLFLFSLYEASGFMYIMGTYIMSVRNNQPEHLKAVCGLPAQFPEVRLANFILPLGRTNFFRCLKEEKTQHLENAVVSE